MLRPREEIKWLNKADIREEIPGDIRGTMVCKCSPTLRLRKKTKSYPYVAPIGTRLNTLQFEFQLGVSFRGEGEVVIEMLQPSLGKILKCADVDGMAHLTKAVFR